MIAAVVRGPNEPDAAETGVPPAGRGTGVRIPPGEKTGGVARSALLGREPDEHSAEVVVAP
jgi:hypothetical protein